VAGTLSSSASLRVSLLASRCRLLSDDTVRSMSRVDVANDTRRRDLRVKRLFTCSTEPSSEESTLARRRRDTRASISPLITQGSAFMGKMSMLSRANAVITSEADSSTSMYSVVTNVAKGTITGVRAQRNTHTESRYFLWARYFTSRARNRVEAPSTAPSRPAIFMLVMPPNASVTTLIRRSLAFMSESVAWPIFLAIAELSGIITRMMSMPARKAALMFKYSSAQATTICTGRAHRSWMDLMQLATWSTSTWTRLLVCESPRNISFLAIMGSDRQREKMMRISAPCMLTLITSVRTL